MIGIVVIMLMVEILDRRCPGISASMQSGMVSD